MKYVTLHHHSPARWMWKRSSVQNGNKTKWNGTWTGSLKPGRYKSIESIALQKRVPLNRSKLTCGYLDMLEPRSSIKDTKLNKTKSMTKKKRNSNWIAFQNFKSHIEGVAESTTRGHRRGNMSFPIPSPLLPLHLFRCWLAAGTVACVWQVIAEWRSAPAQQKMRKCPFQNASRWRVLFLLLLLLLMINWISLPSPLYISNPWMASWIPPLPHHGCKFIFRRFNLFSFPCDFMGPTQAGSLL